jgi:hypothetical protein
VLPHAAVAAISSLLALEHGHLYPGGTAPLKAVGRVWRPDRKCGFDPGTTQITEAWTGRLQDQPVDRTSSQQFFQKLVTTATEWSRWNYGVTPSFVWNKSGKKLITTKNVLLAILYTSFTFMFNYGIYSSIVTRLINNIHAETHKENHFSLCFEECSKYEVSRWILFYGTYHSTTFCTNWRCPFQVYTPKELRMNTMKHSQGLWFYRSSNQVLPGTEEGMLTTTWHVEETRRIFRDLQGWAGRSRQIPFASRRNKFTDSGNTC